MSASRSCSDNQRIMIQFLKYIFNYEYPKTMRLIGYHRNHNQDDIEISINYLSNCFQIDLYESGKQHYFHCHSNLTNQSFTNKATFTTYTQLIHWIEKQDIKSENQK